MQPPHDKRFTLLQHSSESADVGDEFADARRGGESADVGDVGDESGGRGGSSEPLWSAEDRALQEFAARVVRTLEKKPHEDTGEKPHHALLHTLLSEEGFSVSRHLDRGEERWTALQAAVASKNQENERSSAAERSCASGRQRATEVMERTTVFRTQQDGEGRKKLERRDARRRAQREREAAVQQERETLRERREKLWGVVWKKIIVCGNGTRHTQNCSSGEVVRLCVGRCTESSRTMGGYGEGGYVKTSGDATGIPVIASCGGQSVRHSEFHWTRPRPTHAIPTT